MNVAPDLKLQNVWRKSSAMVWIHTHKSKPWESVALSFMQQFFLKKHQEEEIRVIVKEKTSF